MHRVICRVAAPVTGPTPHSPSAVARPRLAGLVVRSAANGERGVRRAVRARRDDAVRRRRDRGARHRGRPRQQRSGRAVPVRRATGRLAGHWRTDNCLDADQLTAAVSALGGHLGSVDRLVAILENLQVPLGEVRERLGIAGHVAPRRQNFRDKARMKARVRARPASRARGSRAAGVARRRPPLRRPVSACRSSPSRSPAPGPATRSGSRITTQLQPWLDAAPPSPPAPMLLEEFVCGEEHSFDSVVVDGRLVWHSIGRYLPSPLDVLEHPWIQWCVLLPRDIDGSEYADLVETAHRAVDGARAADRAVAHGVVPPRRRLGRHLRGRRPAPGRPVHDADVVRPRCRHVRGMGPARRARPVRSAAAPVRRRRRLPAGPGPGSVDRRRPRARPGQRGDHGACGRGAGCPSRRAAGRRAYEGDGYVIVRDPSTAAVEQALAELITTIRLECA